MATKIVTKNSSTAGSAPSASDLVQGELAVNVVDKRLYTEDNAGNIVELGTNPLGEITANGGIALGDNDKATFGASDDLQIYHDGSNSYVQDAGTGNLNIKSNGSFIDIQSDSTRINNATNSEIMATFVANGAVSLYHNNVAKLATASTGIDVNGNIDLPDNGKLLLGAGDDLAIYHNGADSWIANSTGNLNMQVTENAFFQILDPASNKLFRANDDGDVELYHNGNEKLATTATGIDVTGTATMDGLVVQQPSGANILLESTTTGATTGDIFGEIEFKTNDSSSAGVKGKIDSYSEGGVGNGALRLFTGNTTGLYERLRIDSSGNVGIGTDSPSGKLEVSDGSTAKLRVNPASTEVDLLALNAAGTGYVPMELNASEIRFDTSATERMRIDGSGNLLIGTSSSSAKLTVGTFGDTARAAQFHGGSILIDGGAATDLIMGDGNVAYMSIQTTDNATAMKIRDHSGNADLVTVERASGNVGIGVVGKASSTILKVENASGYAPTLVLNQSGVGAASIAVPASENVLQFNYFNGHKKQN